MNKRQMTQELVRIANALDNYKMYSQANTVTKIAHIVLAEDELKHDPMVYNPDESFESEHQENQGDAYNDAMAALHELMESGELSQSDFSQIESILRDDTQEMSFDEDEDDHYMTDEEMDEQFDNDPSDMKDEDDDMRDRNHKENLEGGHYFFQDEDDF